MIWKAVRPQLIDAVALKDEADQLYRDFNGQRVVLERLFDEGGMRAGAAQRLAAALQALQAQQARLQFAMVLALLLALVGAVAAYLWISRTVRRAVSSLSSGVQMIASGQLDVRLRESGDPDFDRVLEGFNQMAERLQATTVSKSELEESEQRLEAAVRGSQAGIWDWNLLSGAYYVSPRVKELFGLAADATGEREFFVSHLHPDDVGRVEAVRRAHFERRGAFDVQYRVRREGGDYLWVRDIGQAKWDETGQVLRFSGSISDIDAQKQAQALHRQRLLQPLAQAGCGAGVLGLQRRRQALQLFLGQLGVGTAPGIAQGTAHAGLQRLGQMLDHVAPLMFLAALHQRQRVTADAHLSGDETGIAGLVPVVARLLVRRNRHRWSNWGRREQ